LKTFFKNVLYSSTLFEQFGFRYMGPIDGHDIQKLCDALHGAKEANYPILLHIKTVKGKGYEFAEKNPTGYHGISRFNIDSGEPINAGANFSGEFGAYLTEAAAKDRRICAVSAAMTDGTGLAGFAEKYPERFFDVGIAEQHAVTFSLGLAGTGMIPVFAVYSSFLQRAYDQLVHDGTLQGQKIILAVDRAGFVGEDGETHHGLLDVPMLNTVPGMTVYSPATYGDMRNCFYKALYQDKGVVAVRYPRGAEQDLPEDYKPAYGSFELYGDRASPNLIVTYGRLFASACKAVKALAEEGVDCAVLKLNRIKPIDKSAVSLALGAENIFFFEECEKSGAVGESFLELLNSGGYNGNFTLTAVEDRFVRHAAVDTLLKEHRLDSGGMEDVVRQAVGADSISAHG